MKPLVFIMFPKKLFSNSKLTCSHISFFVLSGVCPGAKFKYVFILLYTYSNVPLPLHRTWDLSQMLLSSSVCHVYLMAYLAPEPQPPRAVTTELASCNPATWAGDNCLTALPMQWAAAMHQHALVRAHWLLPKLCERNSSLGYAYTRSFSESQYCQLEENVNVPDWFGESWLLRPSTFIPHAQSVSLTSLVPISCPVSVILHRASHSGVNKQLDATVCCQSSLLGCNCYSVSLWWDLLNYFLLLFDSPASHMHPWGEATQLTPRLKFSSATVPGDFLLPSKLVHDCHRAVSEWIYLLLIDHF